MTQLLLYWEKKSFKFAIFPPLGAPPQGPPGVYMPYMNNFGSLPPNNDPY